MTFQELSHDEFRVYTELLSNVHISTAEQDNYIQSSTSYASLINDTAFHPKHIEQIIRKLADKDFLILTEDCKYVPLYEHGDLCYSILNSNRNIKAIIKEYFNEDNVDIPTLQKQLAINPRKPTKPPSPTQWNKLKRKMKQQSYHCYVCFAKENLILHHRNYDTAGNESANDVVWLCHSCHHKVHNGGDNNG